MLKKYLIVRTGPRLIRCIPEEKLPYLLKCREESMARMRKYIPLITEEEIQDCLQLEILREEFLEEEN